jgi:Ca2+:H+ antiporter
MQLANFRDIKLDLNSLSVASLVVLIPLSFAAYWLHWDNLSIFIYSSLAIVPLSIILSTAIEKVAIVTGPTLGGLVNAIFGSATVLIVLLVALSNGLADIVEASITGSILSDLLLFLGVAMLAGGIRYKEQQFQPILARVNGLSMTLAVIAIALPTLVINTSHLETAIAIHDLSIIVASVLIVVYGLTLLFSLKTHTHLYEINLAVQETSEHADSLSAPLGSSYLGFWIIILLLTTIGIGIESESFVSVLEPMIDRLGVTPLFAGVFLVPLISDVSGILTVVRLALRDKMDLMVATAMGDSLIISLFVAPLLVFVGLFLDEEIDLNFSPFNVVALAIAVTVTNLVSFRGRSNWLDGTLLLATYIILGVAFFYHPG